MLIGCGTVSFRRYSLEQALTAIRKAGYEYFETQATGTFCPHVNPDTDDPDNFKRLAENFGFKGVTGLWAPSGSLINAADCVARVSRCIEWAAAAKIPCVFMGDGRKPHEMSDADAEALIRERLCAILEAAGRCRVHLCLEPHGTYSLSAEGLMKLMSMSPSPWLGINYDTANVHRAAYVESTDTTATWHRDATKRDEVETLRAVVSRVVHCHVKDLVPGGAKCAPLGRGIVNLKGCLDILKEAGYQGAVSLETEGEFDYDEASALASESCSFLVSQLGK